MPRTAILLLCATLAGTVFVVLAMLRDGAEPGETAAAPLDDPGASDESAADAGPARDVAASKRRGPAIEGFVVDDAEAPAADVAVECVRLGDSPPPPTLGPPARLAVFSEPARSPAAAWRGATDAAGSFRTHPLPPGHWRVVARSGDGRAAVERVQVAGRADAPVRLRLPARGFTIHGHVERADGGAPAARIALQPVTKRGFSPDEFPGLAWTDAAEDGSFVLAGISANRVNVVASSGGQVVAVGPVLLPREDPLVIRLDEHVTRRRGLVRDTQTKQPIYGARMSWLAWNDGQRTVGTQTTSDANGRFEVPGLEQGRAYVEALGWATEHVWDHGGSDEIVVELARLTSIDGRVVTADGGPAARAIVRSIGRSPSGPDVMATATSAADGSFRLLDAAPSDAFVFVHGGGWTSVGLAGASSDGPNPFFVAAGTPHGLVLTVEPSARAEGRVIDADGDPMPGARVTTWTRAFGIGGQGAPHVQAVCDGAGRFVLADLISGASYSVRAEADGWAQVSVEHVAGGPGGRGLELRLVDSWFVDVRIVAEEDGHPIAGAKVRGDVREYYEVRGFGDDATTDADGRARLGPGPRGEFGVRVDAPDRLRRQEPWWVGTVEREGRAFAEVRVPKGLSIAGRVEVPDDALRNRGRVMIKVGEVLTDSGVAEFWTDPPEFVAVGLASGPHVVAAVLAASDGGTWSGVVRADAGRTDLVIPMTFERSPPAREHTLVVHVLDADGAPVFAADAWARCRRGKDLTAPGAIVSDGVASLRVPDEIDRVEIDVRRARDRQERPLPCGTARIEMPDPRATEFVVRLPTARTIEGRVVDAEGRAMAGARVAAQSVDGEDPVQSTTWSESDGRFRIDGLGPGRFRVGAEVPGGWRAVSPVRVESGATDVMIVVEPVTPARVVVVDSDGAPLPGARVVVNLPPRTHDGTTGADGTFVVPDVVPGASGGLSVAPPESRPDLFPLTIPAWTPQAATFRLQPAAVVSGTVRDPRGRPVAGVEVWCTGEGVAPAPRSWTDSRTDAEGRFTVGRLRPGSQVGVCVAAVDEESVELAQAASGAANLELVFDLGICVRVRVTNGRRGEIESPVRALLADGSERFGRFGPDGVARLANLPPGAVMRLALGPTAEHRWAAASGVVPGEDDVELTLRDGATIAGRVEFPDGFRGDVYGTAERDGFRVDLGFSHFHVRGLPPGTWRLRFEGASRTGERYEGTADVEAGDLDALVTLLPQPARPPGDAPGTIRSR